MNPAFDACPAVRCLSFSLRPLASAFRRPPSALRRLSSAVRPLSSPVCRLVTTGFSERVLLHLNCYPVNVITASKT